MNQLMLRRFAMMGLVAGKTKSIDYFYCNGYDHNDYQWTSVSNLERLDNAPATQTTYAQVNKKGASTEAWIHTLFKTTSIPSNATIIYAYVSTKAFSITAGTKTVQMYCNGVEKSNSVALGTSVATQKFLVSKWTVEEIKALTCRFYMLLGSGETSSKYLRIYGATLLVVWDKEPEYFTFQDQEVQNVIANKIGNGVGITLDAMQVVNYIPGSCFANNTDVVNFDELQYFESLKAINSSAFYGCSNLEVLSVPKSVTSIGAYAFQGCTKLGDLYIPCSISNNVFRGSEISTRYYVGNYTGDLVIKGNLTGNNAHSTSLRFNHIYFYGNTQSNTGGGILGNAIIRNKGYSESRSRNGFFKGSHPFIEVIGDISGSSTSRFVGTNTIPVVHLGRNSVITATPSIMNISYITRIYVGDGSSRQNDEDVLALYLANSSWATYSAKLATWYDYNGVYKWYYVTDNLTNCTNTNPDEWPHITRGNSYHTQIVAEEGYTLQSVQVQMYEAVDDGTTPATPTDITSSVYDSSTGEINITAVTGNVIITASAS